MKKLGVIVVIIILLSSITSLQVFSASPEMVPFKTVDILIEGECGHQTCGSGYNIHGTTYVPIRLIMETTGNDVLWDDKNNAVTIKKNTIEQINNDLSGVIESSDLEAVLNHYEYMIDKLFRLDSRLQVAYELYSIDEELIWLNQIEVIFNGEYKQEYTALSDRIMKYQSNAENDSNAAFTFSEHLKTISDVIKYYEFSIKSIISYGTSSGKEDKKSYFLNRKQAIDVLENLNKDLYKFKKMM